MKRLTTEYTLYNIACGHTIFTEKEKFAERLAIIENILGDE